MTDIIKSIKAINPNAEVTVNADDINQITWLNGTPPIPKEQILAMLATSRIRYGIRQSKS
jgi:hypothetical protein